MNKVIGIGECAISSNQEDTITTYALASCVAVTAYCQSKRAAGMVHIVLPAPAMNEKNSDEPFYYAITGVPLMINRICSKYDCTKSELQIRLFGGAESIREKDFFKLGQKNIQMVEKVLKSMNLSYNSSETGGFISRTLDMNVATGIIMIKSQSINI
jgi:chemotaxis protein CheD